jgi:hypothetical protein
LVLNSKLYHADNDKASIITDGMHIKYFGQPSSQIINTLFQLRAVKEECFMSTIFSLLSKKDPHFMGVLGRFATYCLVSESFGITTSLSNSEILLNIITQRIPDIGNKIKNILNNESI